MSTPSMVVAGGTGNVGSFIVRALLNAGVQVAVPSRSQASFDGLHAHLAASTDAAALERLYSFVGDVGSEVDASRLHDEIASTLGPPNAIVATLGGFTPAPSLLNASTTDLHHVLQSTLIAHFCTYRAFLPGLVKRGGTYVSINGPLGFAPWKDSASGLVSIADAAQHMLFRALAQELEGGAVRIVEVVNYAYIRDKETQAGSPLPGEEVGSHVAELATGGTDAVHGDSVHLKSPS